MTVRRTAAVLITAGLLCLTGAGYTPVQELAPALTASASATP